MNQENCTTVIFVKTVCAKVKIGETQIAHKVVVLLNMKKTSLLKTSNVKSVTKFYISQINHVENVHVEKKGKEEIFFSPKNVLIAQNGYTVTKKMRIIMMTLKRSEKRNHICL